VYRRPAPDDADLARLFDRLKAATDKQEVVRGLPPAEFKDWVDRATPHFVKLRDALEAVKKERYGRVLRTYWEWTHWRDLEDYYVPPLQGPLIWWPPTLRELASRLGLLQTLEKFSASMRGLAAREEELK